MRALLPLIGGSIRNNLRAKAVTAVFIAVTFMCAAGVTAIFCIVSIKPAMMQGFPERGEMGLFLGLIMYTACLMGLGINMNVYAFQSMTREKARGNIEALLATPLKVNDIWLAKSLAVFFPGLVLGWTLALAAMFAVNYIYLVPAIGFVLNPWITVNSFVVAPLLYLLLSLLVHLVGLTGKPLNGNLIVQLFLPLFLTLVINLAIRGIVDAASWPFTVLNSGAAAVTGIIVLLLKPRLTGERIVLSR